ncbi:5356_t:CDS:2 [Diversispora eburnea]|uniref:5356_t:CDS:1 n=1 Tax=Diversispora eburnea TaxID=1213867 RepID=A0A9N8YMY4_9GLOM|nr:5356_t:CDS:2 [Diversispora eburnea]
MSTPSSPTRPRRRNSLIGQWDKTTKVIDVKNKYYSISTDKYTAAQKETFTKWVNIQLRTIHVDDETSKKIPEIKAVDRDFRDGKRLIQLLDVLFEGDPDLPKPERGRTRHHYIANVNKVLQFLQTRLDESGLAALQAIGPVDIVDGNVKLTLGLVYLLISKFHHMMSVFEEFGEGNDNDLTNLNKFTTNGWFDNLEKSMNVSSSPTQSPTLSPISPQFPSIPPPTRFRTLKLNHSTPLSSSSGILFWINMQLIDYAVILPSTSYPVEDFTGMNNGIILTALIHHKNMEWLEDFDLLIQQTDDEIEEEKKSKERLSKCFTILEDKLGIQRPNSLVKMLIESDHNDAQQLKRTGLAWSVYMSDLFLVMSEKPKRNGTLRGTRRDTMKGTMKGTKRLVQINEPVTEVNDSEIFENEIDQSSNDDDKSDKLKNKKKSNNKSRGCLPIYSTGPILPMPPWSPKASILSAIFDWTIGWLLSEHDESDDDESDYYEDGQLCEREVKVKTIRVGKKRSDGSWNIHDANEWRLSNECLSDNEDVPIQLLLNQPSLKYWR